MVGWWVRELPAPALAAQFKVDEGPVLEWLAKQNICAIHVAIHMVIHKAVHMAMT